MGDDILERYGIQEVSGSIPLISTIEALKTIGLIVTSNYLPQRTV